MTANPLPYPKTFLALADEFLGHSFSSAEDTVRVWAPPDAQGDVRLHFVKGMARVCT